MNVSVVQGSCGALRHPPNTLSADGLAILAQPAARQCSSSISAITRPIPTEAAAIKRQYPSTGSKLQVFLAPTTS
jgi:hypothetical protein